MIKRFKEKKGIARLLDLRNGLLFCSLWIIGFLTLTLYPLIQTLVFSFNNVTIKPDGTIETVFQGVKNYAFALATDAAFLTVLEEYVIKTVLYVPVITVISLVLALLLNARLKGTGFFRTVYFLPVIIASGPVIEMFINQGVAEFPGLSGFFDFEAMRRSMPEFLVDSLEFLVTEFIMILWYSGIQILVFMTGLQKIDKSMYEAAAIDGASKWEVFWKIVLPALSPTVMINLVFTVVMQSVFSLNPMIIKIKADMNGSGDGSGYGYSSAMAWMYFIVLILLLAVFLLIYYLIFAKKSKRRTSS